MKQITLNEEQAKLLELSLYDAWRLAEAKAGMIVKDGGQHERHANAIFALYEHTRHSMSDAEPLAIAAPSGVVEAARMGHAALKLARDCFKSACAERTLARVNHALSSAKGAVRNAENKAVRS